MKEPLSLYGINTLSSLDKTKSHFVCEEYGDVRAPTVVGVTSYYNNRWHYDWYIKKETRYTTFTLYKSKHNPTPGECFYDKEIVLSIIQEHYLECFEWLLFNLEFIK